MQSSSSLSTAIPTLQEYYADLGLVEDAWHVGPEHPGLEELGISLLDHGKARILEIGVQSGGFAVPVILATAGRPGFSYVGVDNLEYTNAVPLRLVAGYLALHGVTENVEFFEGDSARVLAQVRPDSFDLILIDHYKPKYPLDLFTVCERGLLSQNGRIVLHDVLTHAAPDWKVCERVCRAFGYEWRINAQVSQGAAVVKRSQAASPSTAFIAFVGLEVRARWYWHAAKLYVRRRIGGLLRAAGLR